MGKNLNTLVKNVNRSKESKPDCLYKLFKNFNQTDALIFVAKHSWSKDASTYEALSVQNLNQYEIYTAQFILSYYANMILISSSNSKALKLSEIDVQHFMVLGGVYINRLNEPLLVNNDSNAFFIRTNFEQFAYNICEAYCIARPYYLYVTLSKNLNLGLDKIFLEYSNIDIENYFKMGYTIYLMMITYGAVFTKKQLCDSMAHFNISEMDSENFLKINSARVNQFKEQEQEKNNSNPYSKNRFNLLNKYPIVEISKNRYVVPNKTIFVKQIFDIFWKFEEELDKRVEKKLGKRFRDNYFYKLFENYVGDILKKTYGKNNVKKINYKKKGTDAEFFDWYVEEGNIVYLFETKGYQLNSTNDIKTGNIQEQYHRKFVDKPICQMYKRIKDFSSNLYPELSIFKDKQLIPIAIYYDIPYISGNIHKAGIESTINNNYSKIAESLKEPDLENFKNFKYYLLSVDDIELFNATQKHKKIKLYDILNKMETFDGELNKFDSLIREMMNIENDKIKITFLEDIYLKFSDSMPF